MRIHRTLRSITELAALPAKRRRRMSSVVGLRAEAQWQLWWGSLVLLTVGMLTLSVVVGQIDKELGVALGGCLGGVCAGRVVRILYRPSVQKARAGRRFGAEGESSLWDRDLDGGLNAPHGDDGNRGNRRVEISMKRTRPGRPWLLTVLKAHAESVRNLKGGLAGQPQRDEQLCPGCGRWIHPVQDLYGFRVCLGCGHRLGP
jgi:hypothetical protein